jgi:hypothetical protein
MIWVGPLIERASPLGRQHMLSSSLLQRSAALCSTYQLLLLVCSSIVTPSSSEFTQNFTHHSVPKNRPYSPSILNAFSTLFSVSSFSAFRGPFSSFVGRTLCRCLSLLHSSQSQTHSHSEKKKRLTFNRKMIYSYRTGNCRDDAVTVTTTVTVSL